MVRVFAILKPLIRLLLRFYGMTSQKVEIEPGTIMNIWVPTKKSKSKPAVVFLHGFAADGIFTWLSSVQALSGKYAVYVPDLLFFGGSITDMPGRSTAFQAEFIAKGLRKLGVERCTVVGLSYGATIGFKMAKAEPDLVECLVASDTVLDLTEAIWRPALEKFGYSNLQDCLLPTTVEAFKAFMSIASNKPASLPDFVARDFLREFYINRRERAELIEGWLVSNECSVETNYTQRIYLVWGDNDKIFDSVIAEDIKHKLGSNANLEFIKEAGHVVQQDQPAAYNQRLKEILASLHTTDLKKD